MTKKEIQTEIKIALAKSCGFIQIQKGPNKGMWRYGEGKRIVLLERLPPLNIRMEKRISVTLQTLWDIKTRLEIDILRITKMISKIS